MKTLAALLLASGMAVTMIPATAVVAQEAKSTTIQEMQLDGATLDQVAAATAAVAVYVSDTFDLEMAPANIADIRAAVDANSALTLFLDSREIDTPDIVGVAANGETTLMIFVAQDASDEADMTGVINDNGMVEVDDGDSDSSSMDMDDEEVDANAEADAEAGAEVSVDDDGVEAGGEMTVETDVTAN